MLWLTQSLGSSIGKKVMMAVTGLCFIGFLAAHLAGNLTIYGGKDAFNAYAEHLHALGILLTVAELGLLGLALPCLAVPCLGAGSAPRQSIRCGRSADSRQPGRSAQ